MKSVRYRLLAMTTIVLVIGACGLLTRHFASLERLVENETRMREFIRAHSWESWFFALAIYTVFSLVPGTSGKSVVCGWLFGFWQGVLLVDFGLTLAAIAGFIVARFTMRQTINERFGGLVQKLNRGLANDGAFYLLLLRMAHLPFSVVNYGAAATSVSLGTFGWTTAVGILPGTMIFVFVGTRIPTLESLAQEGVWRLFDPLLFALLASTVGIPFLVRWAIRHFRDRVGLTREIENSEIEPLAPWPSASENNGAN